MRQFLIQERAVTVGEMEIERLKILGKRLKVDAVITGTVEEFDEGKRRRAGCVLEHEDGGIRHGTHPLVFKQ